MTSRGSKILRMGVLYSASLASLLAGGHIVHMALNPDLVRHVLVPQCQD